ncbi:adult cuticle protein 1-like [Teleopsis dalmanni]|uniref:adult cuticle protein 1-like n=1 Tax=Teleopsis dalmanni TaxID=139649 RepID=UPI0018CD04BC|nr:adult cuticle protein 1-like [Teleopsis dalmanni]
MKLVIAAVMLTLAVGARSSGWDGAWDGAWGGAWDGAWGHSGAGWSGHSGPAAVAVHAAPAAVAWGASGLGHWGGVPGIGLAQGPAHGAAVIAAPAVAVAHGHGHDGVYVAKTRGAVHAAPLASHISSVSAINVAPAPGTH